MVAICPPFPMAEIMDLLLSGLGPKKRLWKVV
jgi:hypothetical protein